jgi:hypothetical protein
LSISLPIKSVSETYSSWLCDRIRIKHKFSLSFHISDSRSNKWEQKRDFLFSLLIRISFFVTTHRKRKRVCWSRLLSYVDLKCTVRSLVVLISLGRFLAERPNTPRIMWVPRNTNGPRVYFPVIRKSISAAPREMVIRVSFNPRVDNQIAAKNWFSGARAAPCWWQTAFWMQEIQISTLYIWAAHALPLRNGGSCGHSPPPELGFSFSREAPPVIYFYVPSILSPEMLLRRLFFSWEIGARMEF